MSTTCERRKTGVPVADLTGQRFGKLVVLGPGVRSCPKKPYHLCRCDCGREQSIRGDALKAGRIECRDCSYGRRTFPPVSKAGRQRMASISRQRAAETAMVPAGQRHGTLTSVGMKQKSHGWFVVATCDCGESRDVVRSQWATSSGPAMCARCAFKKRGAGMMHTATAKRKQAVARLAAHGRRAQRRYVGEVFGRLTVLSVAGRQPLRLKCQCECGTVGVYRADGIRTGDRRSCGCQRREVASLRGSVSKRGYRRWLYKNGDKEIVMRSSYEVMFANVLDQRGVEWLYEPKAFVLSLGCRYTPDFYVPSLDQWYETKGFMSPKSRKKIAAFRKLGKKLTVIRQKHIEAEHPLTYNEFIKAHRPLPNRRDS